MKMKVKMEQFLRHASFPRKTTPIFANDSVLYHPRTGKFTRSIFFIDSGKALNKTITQKFDEARRQ